MENNKADRFEHLVHAYELGIMTDDERHEFELLLMESDEFFEKALEFEKAARLLITDNDLRQVIEHRAAEIESTEEARDAKPAGRKKWFTLVPVSVAAVIIFFLLVLKDWQLQISPSDEARASENILAIVYFDNLTDEEDSEKLGEIITNLLITDLSESQYIQVLSSQHLYDILKRLGMEGIKRVDRETATRVAKEARAKWILTGGIMRNDRETVITTQLLQTGSGHVIASEKVTGDSTISVFALTDQLSRGIREDLPLAVDFAGETDKPVAEVTTHSTEAYRYYIEGVEAYYKFYSKEAVASFEQAISYDSTFAMAYYYLTLLKGTSYFDRAWQYAENVSLKEKYYIRALKALVDKNRSEYLKILTELVQEFPFEKEAYYRIGNYYYGIGDYDEALVNLHRSLEIDPLYKLPYNMLSYNYRNLNNFDSALWAINKYIELAPHEANPYDTRGELYAAFGFLEKAITSYEKAVEIKPDFYSSLGDLGFMYIYNNEYEKAESCFNRLREAERQVISAAASLYKTSIPYYRGQFDQALTDIEAILSSRDSLDIIRDNMTLCYFHLKKALIYDAWGEADSAMKAMEEVIEIRNRVSPNDKNIFSYIYVQMLAHSGEFEEARLVTDSLKGLWMQKQVHEDTYRFALGIIAFYEGNFQEAISELEQAIELNSTFYSNYFLGRAYLEIGNLEKAVETFEMLLTGYSSQRMNFALWSTNCYYYLGLAYERSNWLDKAATQYERYLEILMESDTGIMFKNEAGERLELLRNNP